MTILCHTREISSKSHPIALSRNLKFWHASLIHRNSNFQCKKKKKNQTIATNIEYIQHIYIKSSLKQIYIMKNKKIKTYHIYFFIRN